MLQLFANGQQLDTSGVKFNLTLKNPMFSREKLEGSYIYNFNLPQSNRNKFNFQFPGRLSKSPSEILEQSFRAVFNGIPFIDQSTISVWEANSGLVANVKSGNGNFIYQAQNKYMNELNLGSMTFANDANALAYFNSIVDKIYPEVPFAMPYIVGQTDSYLPSGTTGYYLKDTMNFWNTGTPGYQLLNGVDRTVLVPMLYLTYVLNNMFTPFGIKVIDQVFKNHYDYKKFLLFNLYNINNGIPDEGEKLGYNSSVQKIRYSNHVPPVRILDFISGLQNFMNVTFFFNSNLGTAEIKGNEDLLMNPEYVEFSKNVQPNPKVEHETVNGYKLKANPDDGDSLFAELTSVESEFIKYYGGSVQYLSDLPDYPGRYYFYYVLDKSEFYRWNTSTNIWETNAAHVPLRVKTQIFGGLEEYSLESNFSYLHYDSALDSRLSHGNAAIDYTSFTPRLMFYLGMDYFGGATRPQVSSITDDNMLWWFGNTEGLFDRRWRTWINWITGQNVIVTFKKLMTAKEIRNLDFSKKHRIDGIDYFIKEVKIPITSKAILPATLECIKV